MGSGSSKLNSVTGIRPNMENKDKNWKRRLRGYKYVHRMKIEFQADNQRLGRMLYALAHCSVSPEFLNKVTKSGHN